MLEDVGCDDSEFRTDKPAPHNRLERVISHLAARKRPSASASPPIGLLPVKVAALACAAMPTPSVTDTQKYRIFVASHRGMVDIQR
jgi:hypothetical protein